MCVKEKTMKKTTLKMILLSVCLSGVAHAYDDKGSALINAVDQKQFSKVKQLLESGADINEKGKVGFSALLTAVGWGDVQMVDYLIKQGADLKAKSDRSFGVIHRAAMNKNPKVLKYLLSNYTFDVNDRGKRYCSPLDFALRANALQDNGTLQNAQLLLEYGAKESMDWKCRGYTPLMVAVPDEKVLKFLLDNGAKKEILNASGQSAYAMAVNQKASQKVLDMLDFQSAKSKEKKVFQSKNLIWELKTFDNKYDRYTRTKAVSYCKNLVLNHTRNWRIPTTKEYQTILRKKPYTKMVIDGISRYHLNPKIFTHLTPSLYWVVLEDGTLAGESVAYNQINTNRKNVRYHIRCVRDR
jgi:hypothetical protein